MRHVILEKIFFYVRKELNAIKITLGVFENNPKARHCYESVGFIHLRKETINIQNTDWVCIEMEKQL